MLTEKTVPKRNWFTTTVISTLLIACIVSAYVTWTHLSALMVLRWFVRETGIPVVVRRASWDARLRELLNGKIRDLHVLVYYEPLNMEFTLDTPVEYVRNQGHWSIQLAPTLTVGQFAPARGTVALELDVKREGRVALAEAAEVTLHLHEARPLTLQNQTGAFGVASWKLDGTVHWAKLWSSQLELQLKDVITHNADSTRTLTAKTLQLSTAVDWPGKPPVPLDIKAKVQATGVAISLLDRYKIETRFEEPHMAIDTSFHFDGHNFEEVDISVDNPLKLTAQGSFQDGALRTSFDLRGNLDTIYAKHLQPWLETIEPALRRSKAIGDLGIKGKLTFDHEHGLAAHGKIKVAAQSIEVPARGLYIDDAAIELPLEFPGTPDWGNVTVKTIDFHSVKLKQLSLRARLSKDGVDLTTEDAKGNDRPIRQAVWGGAINIAELYAHVDTRQGTEFTAAITGGPFEISALQTDLCLAPQHPIKGSLSFTYPEVVKEIGFIALVGDTNLDLFNGKAHIGDMRLTSDDSGLRIKFNLDWSDLDMYAISQWTNFGDVRGSLSGSLNNADILLNSDGLIPKSYDFTIRGQQRGGNKMSFYGRSLENILALVGAQTDSIPGANTLMKLMFTLRNWAPAKAEILGFHAQSDGTWTEVSTFDPPLDADPYWCDPKKHYILCGSGFTIPLNTHGVYPVVMSTSAFHDLINKQSKYIEGLMKTHAKPGNKNDDQESQCTPLF